MMKSTRTLFTTLAVIATLGSALIATPVQAKSPKCTAIPVPGQPGHYIVVCSSSRP